MNIYYPDSKTEHVKTLLNLVKMLETVIDFSDKHIVLASTFNFFFDTFLNSYGGKLTTKKKSITKFMKLKEKFHLFDI